MIVVSDFLDFIFPVMVVKHCSNLALLPYLPVCPLSLLPQLFYISVYICYGLMDSHFFQWSTIPYFPFVFCFWFSNSFTFGHWEPLQVAFCVLTFLLNIFVISDLIRCSRLLYPWCPVLESVSEEPWSLAQPVLITTGVSLPLNLSELVLLLKLLPLL